MSVFSCWISMLFSLLLDNIQSINVIAETCQAKTLLASEFHYLAEECTEELHARIASSFTELVIRDFLTIGGGSEICAIENILVECGERSITLRRRDIVDSVQTSKVPITVKFAVKVPLPGNVSVVDLNQTTQQIRNEILVSLNETDLTLNISGVFLEYDASNPPVLHTVGLVCDRGQVQGTKCVSCPPGYFLDITGCQACALDQYQDQESQTFCVSCPSGTSTLGQVASKKPEDCRDNTPPSFNNTCPSNKVFYTDKCSSRRSLRRWKEPIATDDSGHVSISYPAIRPPVNLSVGLYNVLYSAIDSSGNQVNCTFIVQVAIKSCPVLKPPIHGSIASLSCGSAFGSQASFACETGYRMAGSPLRSCTADGTWSGNVTSCNIVKCPSIAAPSHGMVFPSTCQIPSGVYYKTECFFTCNVTAGYQLEGASKVFCLASGSWSDDTTKTICRDIQDPNIKCPPDMDSIPTEPSQSYAIVNWQIPVPTDNSNDSLKLDGLRPPQRLNVGRKNITYKVTDSSGLSRSCVFLIHVQDLEPPTIANCPNDIYKTSEEKWTKTFFPGVTVTDNVGVHLFKTSRPNGSEFTWGEHNVTYNATDIAGNIALCHFQVIIGANRCPDLPTPLNGAKTCDQSPDEKSCILHCHIGYDFANNQPQPYVCSPIKGAWMPSNKVPDCSGTHQAKVLLAIELHYLADKCTEEMNSHSSSNFIALYTQYLGTLGGCHGNEDCTIENVKVECAGQGIKLGRRRLVYSELASKVPLTMRFAVKIPLPSNVSLVDLNQTTQRLSSNVLTSLKTDLSLNSSGVVLEYDASKPPLVRVVSLVCDEGQVLKGTKCVPCAPGYFFNATGCQACAVNQYQDQEAQTSCVPCPSGTSTLGEVASKLCHDRGKRKPAGSDLVEIMSVSVAASLTFVILLGAVIVRRCYLRRKRTTSSPVSPLAYTTGEPETVIQIANGADQYSPSCSNETQQNHLPTSFPRYTKKVEGKFTSTGGELSASMDSNIRIIIPKGAIPVGKNQPIFFGVFLDETPLLRDIPGAPDETLISPVVECGPHDIHLSKSVEIIVPHCLCLSEAKKEWITVYRCGNFSAELEGRLSWERVPNKSEKNSHSKCCFTVKNDSIRIRTKMFSLWSIFACGGPRRKRATVFANRPDPRSDLIYLRFYVYSDNEDSKRRVELRDRERFPDSKPAREQPFRMYNDNREITVKLTDLEKGWEFDKTNDTQIYHYDKASGNGFRSKNACDFAVKPEDGRDVNGFSCMVKFQQEDDDQEYSIYLNPGFHPLKRQSIRRGSAEDGRSVTASCNTCAIAGCSNSTGPAEEEKDCDSFNQARRSSQDFSGEKGYVQCDFTSLVLSDDQPVTEKVCCGISPYVGVKWKPVLRKLSIEEAIIRNLEEDYKNASVDEKCYQGLLAWKDARGPQGATIKKLCDALCLVGCSEALKALQGEIAPQNSDC